MIVLWTLKERDCVVMVRSEYFAEFRRLVMPSTRLEGVFMIDYDCCKMSLLVERISGWARDTIDVNDMIEK